MFKKLERVFSLASKRYATSFYLWLGSAPLLSFGLVLTELSSNWVPEKVLPVLTVGLIAHLALGVVLWIGSKTVLSPARREIAGWKEVLGVYVLAGLIRGVSIGYFIEAFGVGETNYQTRINTAVVLVSFSFTFAAYSAELWRNYSDKRYQLLSSIAVGERVDSLREIAATEYRPLMLVNLEQDIEIVRAQTKKALSSIRQKIRDQQISSAQIKEAFEESDKNWRTLSHKAWIGSLPNVPRISALELFRTLAVSKPISLVALSAGPVYGATRIFSVFEPSQAIFAGLVWWISVVAIAVLTNNWAAKAKKNGLFILSLGFVAIQVTAYILGNFFLAGSTSQSELWFVSFVSSAVAVALGLPPALERLGQSVLNQLDRRLDNTALENLRAQGEMFVLAQRIGSYLHSEVRGDFLRHSLALREALEREDSANAERVLDTLDQLVSEIDLAQSDTLPIEKLKTFLDNWNGVIQVTHNLTQVAVPEGLQRITEEIVMESVNNAVRHGHASWVKIHLSKNEKDYELLIQSDSRSYSENLTEGIGTKILDRHAPNRWSWEFVDSGADRPLLSLKISLLPQLT